MLAISLWQPWASLVAFDAKRIETRSWRFPFSMPRRIAIHAAKKWNGDLAEMSWKEPFAGALRSNGVQWVTRGSRMMPRCTLPFGAVIAIATVRECLPTADLRERLLTEGGDGDLAELKFGDYSTGRWGWVMEDIRRLREPLPFRGTQGFFTVPDEQLL